MRVIGAFILLLLMGCGFLSFFAFERGAVAESIIGEPNIITALANAEQETATPGPDDLLLTATGIVREATLYSLAATLQLPTEDYATALVALTQTETVVWGVATELSNILTVIATNDQAIIPTEYAAAVGAVATNTQIAEWLKTTPALTLTPQIYWACVPEQEYFRRDSQLSNEIRTSIDSVLGDGLHVEHMIVSYIEESTDCETIRSKGSLDIEVAYSFDAEFTVARILTDVLAVLQAYSEETAQIETWSLMISPNNDPTKLSWLIDSFSYERAMAAYQTGLRDVDLLFELGGVIQF